LERPWGSTASAAGPPVTNYLSEALPWRFTEQPLDLRFPPPVLLVTAISRPRSRHSEEDGEKHE
jgi:hypothetical protein